MDFTIKTQRPVGFCSRLVFVLFSVLFSNTTMASPSAPAQDSLHRRFTVAKVYTEKYSPPGTVQITFYESARFYKIENQIRSLKNMCPC